MLRLTLYYLCGVLAAAQIGKLATLAPPLQRELGIGLAAMAALIGLIEAGGALLGARAGRLAEQFGLAPSLRAAMLLLAAAGAWQAVSSHVSGMAAARLLEAAGYLGVIVAAPVLIAHDAGPRRAAIALTVWSTFVPVGLAVGAALHGALADAFDWRVAVACSAGAALLLALALLTLPPRSPVQPLSAPDVRRRLPAAAWCLAGGFGAFALISIGVLALLPTLLTQRGLGVAEAGRWTAWASLATVPGSLAVALVAERPQFHRALAALSLLSAGALTFVIFDPAAALPAVLRAALLQNAALGLFGGLAFAVLPRVAGERGTARAYGLLAQFGASGSLAGPPLLAAVYDLAGWRTMAALCAVLAIGALALAAAALPSRHGAVRTQSAP